MKLNFKTMKKNRIILIVAVIIVVAWMFMHSGGRVEFNEGEKAEVRQYLEEHRDSISDGKFLVHAEFKKLTDDEDKLHEVLFAAGDNDYDRLMVILDSL
jgi:hypothetical protein